MFLRTRCSKLNMRELIIQGCPYWVYGGSPPIIRKSTQPPLPAKIPPPLVDHHHHHPHPFTRKVDFTPHKITKASPRTYIFQSGFLVAYTLRRFYSNVWIFKFEDWKRISQASTELLFLQVTFVARDERCDFFFFIKR